MEAKEEIRARLNIEDVIGEYIQLQRAGRNFKGISPFSNEKTPSFMVSPDKHIWHDFSSNKGGDVFSFIMEVEGIDFRGALEILARKAGVDLAQYETARNPDISKKKERLYSIHELATRFYQQNLIGNTKALAYVFKKRKLSKEVVQTFQIGYSPVVAGRKYSDALVNFLVKRGYHPRDIEASGLGFYLHGRGMGDTFRGRMMVPLCDAHGRVVGFTARLIDELPHAPKYINSAQTLLYDKGRQVFGLHVAKGAIRTRGYVVIVEGNLDVIASHQAGVTNIVATAGTAMTDAHLRALSRLTDDIRLAFDRDQAGIAATERAITIASNLGVQLRVVPVPDGFKDPDELIQSDPKQWQAVVEQPLDAIEWLLDEYARRFDLATAEGKRRTTSAALEIIGKLTDPVEQEHYLSLLAERAQTSLNAIQAKLNSTTVEVPQKRLKPIKVEQSGPDPHSYQDHLLALALTYPPLRDSLLRVNAQDFVGGMRQTVFQLIKKLGAQPVTADLLEKLQSDELRATIKELELIVESEKLYSALDDKLYFRMADYTKRLHIDQKRREIARYSQNLKQTTNLKEQQEANQHIRVLEKEIEDLKH